MRMSRLFVRTLRESPAGAEIPSHRWLVRAGFIDQLGAGIFTLLPLGRRVTDRIEEILRSEMDRIGGQEVTMPVVNPADVWKETGRYYQIGGEMGRFTDRSDRDMVLAMTHEEVVAHLVRTVVQSYKDLPRLIYHVQTKWRDDARPRAGLIRVREFTMKDSYSLDVDDAGLDDQYRAHYQAYFDIFHRCGLPVVSVLADVGMMGGSASHEFMYLTPVGEDTLLICDGCGHRANRQVAVFDKGQPTPEEPEPLEKVATPDAPTIEALARFLDVPESRTAKVVFQTATLADPDAPSGERARLVMALVRGDMELSETKLRNAVGAKDLRPATDEEIRAVGAVPGYASPVGIEGALVVADDLVAASPNLVGGANEAGFHLLNVNHGRDFEADLVQDIVAASDGDPCPACGGRMVTRRGVEVGNIFKLGTRYTRALGATFLDPDGKPRPVVMGSYGIGSGRLLACIAEEHCDERGLCWPISVAPFDVHIVGLKGGEEVAESLYRSLDEAGVDVLWDDRLSSAGVMFNDADLIGVPIRLTVGSRSLAAGGVELKLRRDSESRIVPLEEVEAEVLGVMDALWREIADGVVEVPFD